MLFHAEWWEVRLTKYNGHGNVKGQRKWQNTVCREGRPVLSHSYSFDALPKPAYFSFFVNSSQRLSLPAPHSKQIKFVIRYLLYLSEFLHFFREGNPKYLLTSFAENGDFSGSPGKPHCKGRWLKGAEIFEHQGGSPKQCQPMGEIN